MEKTLNTKQLSYRLLSRGKGLFRKFREEPPECALKVIPCGDYVRSGAKAPDTQHRKIKGKRLAIYHFSAKSIGRSAGRSATAAAAYRSAEKIVDHRTGVVHDFKRKRGVEGTLLVLPGGGTEERAKFWNRIEVHHKRGDAILAREVEVALPSELSGEERKRLAFDYARELADRYGVAADVAIHAPSRAGDERNHHAHIMLSACTVMPTGELGKKAVELDQIHCQRHKLKNMADRERSRWAELTNERLAGAARIDHRSLTAQGVDRPPSVHDGPVLTLLKRATKRTHQLLEDLEATQREEIIMANEHQQTQTEQTVADEFNEWAEANQAAPANTSAPKITRTQLADIYKDPVLRRPLFTEFQASLAGTARTPGGDKQDFWNFLLKKHELAEDELNAARLRSLALTDDKKREEKQLQLLEIKLTAANLAKIPQQAPDATRLSLTGGPPKDLKTATKRARYFEIIDDETGVVLGHVTLTDHRFEIVTEDKALAARLGVAHAIRNNWKGLYTHGDAAFTEAIIKLADAEEPPLPVFSEDGRPLNAAAEAEHHQEILNATEIALSKLPDPPSYPPSFSVGADQQLFGWWKAAMESFRAAFAALIRRKSDVQEEEPDSRIVDRALAMKAFQGDVPLALVATCVEQFSTSHTKGELEYLLETAGAAEIAYELGHQGAPLPSWEELAAAARERFLTSREEEQEQENESSHRGY